ncbi:GNAT family N-acetyltransferase [Fusibacter sp. A1]|nr:GNAT family N-acetyltransferase [Fusibacter sp. A2]NPE23221.1 GNAT family N-acetyltransferase [Fusibacter sp. A1]RXV59577.1 GNAT family N-acetyltransferase [Fusibacter sp. A1]
MFILEDGQRIGAAVLHVFKHTVRIYSIAVRSDEGGKGYGKELLEFCENHARGLGVFTISLEADATDMRLVSWYQKQHYEIKETLPDYYAQGINAFRMHKSLDNLVRKTGRLQNIVITEREYGFLNGIPSIEVISPNDYLTQKRFQTSGQYRIFNLTNSYAYQSKGYYMSLLATARDHRVIPNVATMSDIGNLVITSSISDDIMNLVAERFRFESGQNISYTIVFGHEISGQLTPLSKALYQLFEAPCLRFEFVRAGRWLIESSALVTINEMQALTELDLNAMAQKYFGQRKFNRIRIKNYEYDLAILIDPCEVNPPSNPIALEKFKKAADKAGFFVEVITKNDAHRINEFDALFIRETTSVNSHTYLMARHAHAEGLVVIDDPWSILKCSNKFYLQERMQIAKIPMPKSQVLHTGIDWVGVATAKLNFPMVIKQPDSAFSLGVHKAKTIEDLISITTHLFETSEFVIAQEFMPTDYDWRIGILDNQPLFACKYLMAKGHWQIYNWNSAEQTEGDSIAVKLIDVPEAILKTALKATSFIGDGFYGVDLKESNGKVYLIEINDNPNIDAGVEDVVLGDELYERIMLNMKERIIKARNIDKYIDI